VHEKSRFLAASLVLLTASHPVQTPLRLAPFDSIRVNTGHVVLRSGPTQSVTLIKGSLDYTRVAVSDGVLVIDKCNMEHCPRGYELDIEIQMPTVSRLSLMNGGRIQTLGSFAGQADLRLAVAHGGTIDVRSMAVDRVNASVEQGGRILTVPRGSLIARINQGGVVTYWGNPRVDSSVRHGGVVNKGTPEELSAPLADIGPAVVEPIAPIPPLKQERK
jgi:hypothetical protein